MPRTTPVKFYITPFKAQAATWAVSLVAFLLSALSTGSCLFIDAVDAVTGSSYIGLYTFLDQNLDYCIKFDKEFVTFNASNKAARVFAIFAALIGGIAFLSLTTQVFLKLRDMAWHITTGLMFVAFACQCLTFLLFDSALCRDVNVDCRVAKGGGMSLAAAVLYILLGVFMAKIKVPAVACIAFDVSPLYKSDDTVQEGDGDGDNEEAAGENVVVKMRGTKDSSSDDSSEDADPNKSILSGQVKSWKDPQTVDEGG